jgi:acyl dehydratase
MNEQVAEMSHDEQDAIAKLRSSIGMLLDSSDPYDGRMMPFYSEVTRDAIRHYAWAIGDLNPLWFNEDYARRSANRQLTAMPSILFSLAPGGMSGFQFGELKNLYGKRETWGGADIRWFLPLGVGTSVTTETRLQDVEVKRGRSSGILVKLTARTLYYDNSRELLAQSDSWIFRKRENSHSGTFKDASLKRWSHRELMELAAEKARHVARGSQPRPWADVKIGDIFSLVKGPYSMSANFCYSSLWHPTHSFSGDLSPDDLLGEVDDVGDSLGFPDVTNPHRDARRAASHGLPGPYDYGPQRHSWATQLLTNWMGDAGFLEALDFQVRDFCFLGDVQRFTGTVTAKQRCDGRHLVSCRIECRNQAGRMTGSGEASVRLAG